jgi:N-acetylglutamate synthase-like GNAT family acetyltransferase
MTFILAEKENANQISQLVNSCYRGESAKKGWTSESDILGGQRTDPESIEILIESPNQYFLLAMEDSKMIGSLNLEKTSSEICYFGMFAVDPNIQNAGVGKKMLQEAERFAKEILHCQKMEMSVISIRTELIDWYLRRGYHRTDEVRPFPMNDERFGIPKKDHLELVVLAKNL